MLVSNSNRSNIYTNSSSSISISSSSIISNWDNSNWDNSNLASLYSSMPLPWRTTSNKPACISPLLRSLHTTHVSNNRRSSSSSSSNAGDAWAKRLTQLVEKPCANALYGDGNDVERLQSRITQLEAACRAAARDLTVAQQRHVGNEHLFQRLQGASCDLRVTIQDTEVEFDDTLRDRHVKYRVLVKSPCDPSLGTRTVRRRFSEFTLLHSQLHTTLELPPKSIFMRGLTGQRFLNGRRRQLETWLQRIVALYSITQGAAASSPLRAFLNLDAPFALVLPSTLKDGGGGGSGRDDGGGRNSLRETSVASSVAPASSADEYSSVVSYSSSFDGGSIGGSSSYGGGDGYASGGTGMGDPASLLVHRSSFRKPTAGGVGGTE
mmetsp:Transcript_40419/g.79647  ORF Transcript_40419/g.79647 Transcript_40419/m.79647 type:complete len:379 (+) Transcript_40419:2171-3307(+)